MSAIIAKALNSTVGQEQFKSFDQLIADNVRLVGSNNTFYVYEGEWQGAQQNTELTSEYIEFDIGGSVDVYTTLTTGATEVKIKAVYASGKTIERTIATPSQSGAKMRLNVSPGDKVSFNLRSTSNSSARYPITMYEMYIGATAIPCTKKCTLA